ncbi:MAG: chitinase [Lachnospiraceae bacterium]|nr:chitinase [Lachnospiraceae bacterium]
MKRLIPALIAIVLILVIAGITVGTKIWEKYSYSNERANLKEYFHIESDDQAALILHNEQLEEKALFIDGAFYFSKDFVLSSLNDRFYEDAREGLLLYTTPTDIIRSEIGTGIYTEGGENKSADCIISRYVDDRLYISADYVKQYTNYDYEIFEKPYRLKINTGEGTYLRATVSENSAIRRKGGVKSPILVDVSQGDEVAVLEELEDWDKVCAKGAIGYIEKKFLSDPEETPVPKIDHYDEPEYTSLTRDYMINMAWHQVMSAAANSTFDEAIAKTKGLNVISPTWFSLSDNYGNIKCFATTDYVAKAHKKGMEVWGLVDNFDPNISTLEVLSSLTTRQNLIDNLIREAGACGMEGINIDFEQLSGETGPHFEEFIRELSIACRKNGLVLSVDNYVPTESSDHYGRKAQGEVADYVIIMGYDEHWGSGGVAGSVASIDFVENGIQKTLEEVPASKVINALPFYTRIWETKGSTVTSEAVGMDVAATFLANKGVSAKWDDTTCQNYAEFQSGDSFYQVWLEDDASIGVKLDIMKKYNLAGVSAWKLGFETASVWDVIDSYVNG